jgi:hypothetical protein
MWCIEFDANIFFFDKISFCVRVASYPIILDSVKEKKIVDFCVRVAS